MTSKTKKKGELVKSVLGVYLKQRNYQTNNRKNSDSTLKMMDESIKNESSRCNSFAYSSPTCLNNPNNHPGLVDQQFSKVAQFIQNIKSKVIREDLFQLLPALMCHLYVEMLKGQEWKAAIQFLRKNATIVGQIESGGSGGYGKVNGTVEDVGIGSGHSISFVDEGAVDRKTQTFRELITTLSTMRNLQDLDADELVANFRSCKYQASLREKSIGVLKGFLAKNVHVVIIQTLQIWFHIDTVDDKVSDGEDEVMEDSSYNCGLNGFSSLDDLNDISKFTNLLASPTKQEKVVYKMEDEEIEEEDIKPTMILDENIRLKTIQGVLERIETHQQPVQIFTVRNSDQFCTADIDADGCHVACAFENSSIVLWSADRSSQIGRKPFASVQNRECDWNILNTEYIDDGVSSSDEEDEKFKRKKDAELFMRKRCGENMIDDISGYTLRGHEKAVTDVIFSKSSPLLFSTSRDFTMRAWKASSYACAAIYRGHNYPIWCVAESSTGLYLATGSRDSTARLWSTDREFPLQMYVGHTQDVTTVAFHPNGNYLATGSVDLTVRLWDITSGKLLRVFTDAKLPIYRVSFSPNGKFIAIAGEESRVRIFDIASGGQFCELKDHPGAVTDLVWKPDSFGLATATNSGVIRMYDLTNLDSDGNPQAQQHPHGMLQQQFGTQCKRIVKMRLFNEILTCIGSE